MPSVQILGIEHKNVGAEAARVFWEQTWKCFWGPRDLVGFAGPTTVVQFGSEYLQGRWWRRVYGSPDDWLKH